MAIIRTIMARRTPYALIYPPAVKEHLQAIDAKYHRDRLFVGGREVET